MEHYKNDLGQEPSKKKIERRGLEEYVKSLEEQVKRGQKDTPRTHGKRCEDDTKIEIGEDYNTNPEKEVKFTRLEASGEVIITDSYRVGNISSRIKREGNKTINLKDGTAKERKSNEFKTREGLRRSLNMAFLIIRNNFGGRKK